MRHGSADTVNGKARTAHTGKGLRLFKRTTVFLPPQDFGSSGISVIRATPEIPRDPGLPKDSFHGNLRLLNEIAKRPEKS
jgi:hypothetical protein